MHAEMNEKQGKKCIEKASHSVSIQHAFNGCLLYSNHLGFIRDNTVHLHTYRATSNSPVLISFCLGGMPFTILGQHLFESKTYFLSGTFSDHPRRVITSFLTSLHIHHTVFYPSVDLELPKSKEHL